MGLSSHLFQAQPTATPVPFNLGEPIVLQDSPKVVECDAPACAATWSSPDNNREVVLADLSAEITFFNPSEDVSWFHYGLFIRNDVRIDLFKYGQWEAYTRSEIGAGHVENLNKKRGTLKTHFNSEPGGSNHLRVTAVGYEACFYVNGHFASCFTVPEWATAGRFLVPVSYGGIAYGNFVASPILPPLPPPTLPTPTPRPAITPMPTATPVPFNLGEPTVLQDSPKVADCEYPPCRGPRGFPDNNVILADLSAEITFFKTRLKTLVGSSTDYSFATTFKSNCTVMDTGGHIHISAQEVIPRYTMEKEGL